MRQTAEIKAKLDWMAEHPGEWMLWGRGMFPASARHVHEPSFERKIVSPSRANFDYLPVYEMPSGLYVRYVGSPCSR